MYKAQTTLGTDASRSRHDAPITLLPPPPSPTSTPLPPLARCSIEIQNSVERRTLMGSKHERKQHQRATNRHFVRLSTVVARP